MRLGNHLEGLRLKSLLIIRRVQMPRKMLSPFSQLQPHAERLLAELLIPSWALLAAFTSSKLFPEFFISIWLLRPLSLKAR